VSLPTFWRTTPLVAVLVALAACGTTTSPSAAGRTADGSGLTTGTPTQGLEAPAQSAGPDSDSPSGMSLPESTDGVAAPGAPAGPGGTGGVTIAQGPTGTGQIPATGPGWDEKFIYVGVVTNQDIQQVANTLGVDSLDSGDQKADAEAMIADLNARGGLFGRQLKGVFLDVKSSDNADSNGQKTCTYFTQDHKVVALMNRVLQNDTPSFRACMTKARTMVFAGGTQTLDDRTFSRENGWYVHLTVPSWNRFAPALVGRLKAQGFFSTWDTTAGAPGALPVKVGIVATDNEDSRRVVALLDRELAKVSHASASTVFYTDQSGLQAAVLRFRSDGVTHVLNADPFLFLFMQNAESQGYRPRYAVNTLNGPSLLLSTTAPPAQLNGVLGLGWAPTFDVDASHDAPSTRIPGAATCRNVMARRGPHYPPEKRYAVAYFNYYCDAMRLLVSAATVSGGLTPDQIRSGVRQVGAQLQPAFTFTNAMDAQVATVPGSASDLRWDSACRCFRYSGALRPT
jgi:hypothetical protein